jgi:hypothetical protein
MLHQDGERRWPRHLNTRPETLRKAMAPDREELGVAVDWICIGDGRADRCAQEPLPLVLGPTRSMNALHGGQATPAQRDAQNLP